MTKMAVHNGVFHADDVFAVAMMKGIKDDLEVIRTRNEEVLGTCDIVADVGGGQYDHHQADKVLREDEIPYCAFGLLWKDFGKDYVQKQFPDLKDEKQIEEVVQNVGYEFISQIDASDNGVDVNTYEIPITTISNVISSFMPFGAVGEEVDKAFFEAVAFAEQFFYKIVRKYVEHFFNRNYIESQLHAQPIKDTHILVLEEHVGWKDALLHLDTDEDVYFVVFQDITGSWRVQTVPKSTKGFEARYDLPETWGGLREEELTELTGIAGCIFCHPSFFICGNATKEGALEMARQAVANIAR
ncbi:MAG: MYG1 family protein [Cellulosilyticaceae bacterium]